MAAAEPPEGTVSPEMEALREAEIKGIEKTLTVLRWQGRCLSYTKISLAKTPSLNGPLSWPSRWEQFLGLI